MKMKKLLALAMDACLTVATYSVGFAANSSTNNRGSSSSSSSHPLSKESENYYASLNAQKTANGTGVATVAAADNANVQVATATQTSNGATVTIRTTAGTAAAGVQTAPMLIVNNGTATVGCYVDMTTGRPVATGKTEIYMSYNEAGVLVYHYVDANGFFLTGVHVINGVTLNFNAEGTPIA